MGNETSRCWLESDVLCVCVLCLWTWSLTAPLPPSSVASNSILPPGEITESFILAAI